MMPEHDSVGDDLVGGPDIGSAAGPPPTKSIYEYVRQEPLPMEKKAKRRGIASPLKGVALPVKRLRVASQRYSHPSGDEESVDY